MIGRRIATVTMAVLLAAICFPFSPMGAGAILAAPVNASFQVKLSCSVGNPPGSYAAHCGLTLGMTAHLKGVTNHAMGGGYELWITGKRVTPSPAVTAASTVCTSSPCLSNRFVTNGNCITHTASYDFHAWMGCPPILFSPSHAPADL